MARPMVKITAGEIIKILEPVLKKMDRDIAAFDKATEAYPALLAEWEKKAHAYLKSKGVSKGTVSVERGWNEPASRAKAYIGLSLPLSEVAKVVGKRPAEPVDPKWGKPDYKKGKLVPAERAVINNALTIYRMADPKEKVSVPVNAEWVEYLKY